MSAIGRYEIGALIGKSATGSVFRASADAKVVAIKLVHPSSVTPERLAELREFAAAMTEVKHPGIVPLIELFEHEKAICLVSEIAAGEPLEAILKSAQPPDLRRTWDIARQVLEALEAAHAQGVVHGGLKPSNIFIDAQGRVALTDFGLAELVPNTAPPGFMAPEQLSDRITNARSDIYQAGALVYLLATTKAPFTGAREEVVHRVMQERPADPSSIVAKLAWQLDWVVQRALSKDPADRFGGAREFMDGLRLGLQESIGAPLPVSKTPKVEPKPAAKPASSGSDPKGVARKPAATNPKPASSGSDPEGADPAVAVTPPPALAQKAKLIAAAPIAAPKPAPVAPPKPCVLFVDDEERVLNALRALFRDEFDVCTAGSGAAALEMLKAKPVQIVVSDQRMPGMTGVELLREVRKLHPRSVRILLTGYSDLAALVGSINDGEVFRFVKKPWDNDEIREVMKEAAALASRLAPAPAAKLQEPQVAGSVLVIDTDTSLAKGLQRMLGDKATVREAASPAEAAKVLQSHDVAAVVADLRAGGPALLSLFKLLKAKRPHTLSILLSGEPDSESVTEMINQAHVHRLLAKPVNARELLEHVTEALQRYTSGFAEGVAPLPDRLVTDAA